MLSSRNYLFVLLLLLALFSSYNYVIYTQKSSYGTIRLSQTAIKGENLWLTNNCNACHQIYGLGGYLGPDLTNIYSFRKKDENYLKSIINSGIKAMPKFDFNEMEKEELIQFLKEVDQTGHYSTAKVVIESNGWVKIKEKNN